MVVPERMTQRQEVRSALGAQFWELPVSSARSLGDGAASALPCEPPPLASMAPQGAVRAQQLLAIQAGVGPLTPGYDGSNGGVFVDRTLACVGGRRWWAAALGRARVQRLWGTHARGVPLSEAVRDLSAYSLAVRARVRLSDGANSHTGRASSNGAFGGSATAGPALNVLVEAPDARSLSGLRSIRRGISGGAAEEEPDDAGDDGRPRPRLPRSRLPPLASSPPRDLRPRARAWLTAPLPGNHDARVSVSKDCPFVDGAASYEVVPLAVAADVASRPRADGIQYRVGLHQVWAEEAGGEGGRGGASDASGRGGASDAPPSPSPPLRRRRARKAFLHPPTTHFQGAVAVEGEATLWRAPPPRRRGVSGWRASTAAASATAAAAAAAKKKKSAAAAAAAAAAKEAAAALEAASVAEAKAAEAPSNGESTGEKATPSPAESGNDDGKAPPSPPPLSLSSLSAKRKPIIVASLDRDDDDLDDEEDEDDEEEDPPSSSGAATVASASPSDTTAPSQASSFWPRYAPFGSPPRLRQPPLPGGRLEAAEKRQRRTLRANGVAVVGDDDDEPKPDDASSSGDDESGTHADDENSAHADALASLVGADYVIDLGPGGLSSPVAPAKKKKETDGGGREKRTLLPLTAEEIESKVRSASAAASAARTVASRLRRAIRAAAAKAAPGDDGDGDNPNARTVPYAPGVGQPGARLFGAVGCLARIPLPGALFAVGRPGGGERRTKTSAGDDDVAARPPLRAASPPRKIAAAAASLLRAPVATATAAASAAASSAALFDGEAWSPYLRHTSLRAFGSVGAALQLGRFTRPVLDFTHVSARLDLGLTSAGDDEDGSGHGSRGSLAGLASGQGFGPAADAPPALLHGGRSHPLHGRGTWHALSASAVQQVAGPLRLRADARFALEAVPASVVGGGGGRGGAGGDDNAGGRGGNLLLPPLSPLRRPATPSASRNHRPGSSSSASGRRGGPWSTSGGGGGGGGRSWRGLGGGTVGTLASAASSAADAARRIRPARLETVFGADYVLPGTEGTLRLCGWWSPARREAMCELRLL